ncbi:MAG: tRNA (5-methylaminomethyl-2-thiouridine)(34)-methyltransferase MnmD [Cyclobacteriaceae bacterium]
MKVEIIKTKDGSTSLLVPEMNETYHSTHGALTESQYVFIDKGLKHYCETIGKKEINILEVGFGTGLNALLTCLESKILAHTINYFSLETDLIEKEVWSQLNYHGLINDYEAGQLFDAIHSAPWDQMTAVTGFFNLQKINLALQEYTNEDLLFDLVYFDAFAPSKQAEMWELSLFEKIFRLMKPQGILVTYCAQGQFKRNLKSCGFEVEKLPGPPGKAEMTRACKI